MALPKSTPKTEHEYVEERLSAYIDGQLGPEQQAAVERHLASCQDCQWNLSTLRQTVQWTRELPTVSVPRAFTIPVPARPERARRWRWSLPVLQGATALVALLLVFVVAGDFLLTGRLAGVAPPLGGAVMEQPAAEVQPSTVAVTEAVLDASLAAEEPQAEDKAQPSPSAAPTLAAEKALPAETVLKEAEVAATPTPENTTMGAAGFEPPAEGQKEAVEAPRAAAVTEALQATAVVEPTPTLAPTVAPTLAPTAAPTILALAPEAAEAPAEREAAVSKWQSEPPIHWLGAVEIVLAVAFVLLAGTTIALMVRQHS